MPLSFTEVLERLRPGWTGVCEHFIGSASFDDEDAYDLLGRRFDEAVATFIASDGEPIEPTPRFPEVDVDRAAFWLREDRLLYALLSFEDNTRIRSLTLGITRRETVVLVS